jgi:hypothetical protein
MTKVLETPIDPNITLPPSCDTMPDDLRGHLLFALTDACRRYSCEQKDLRWEVKAGRTGELPYIRIKKR